jgi:hypothetical protein
MHGEGASVQPGLTDRLGARSSLECLLVSLPEQFVLIGELFDVGLERSLGLLHFDDLLFEGKLGSLGVAPGIG